MSETLSSAPPLLLPERDHIWSPALRGRLLRAASAYAGLLVAAAALASLAHSDETRAFALGLMGPGFGFLMWATPGAPSFAPHLALWIAGMAAFAGAVIFWFATGAIIAPVLVWLAEAVLAANCGDGRAWPAAVWIAPIDIIAALDVALVIAVASGQRAKGERRHANAYLTACLCEPSPVAPPPAGELSRDDLRRMRLLLDRALQPIDEFEGFEWIDQFQTAAIRYQSNFLSYALSIAQAERLPAFRAYLSQAQENLVLKQMDHRVWRYWRLESLWGNLRDDVDPIPRDNIMFTGFLATQIALFQAASGSRRFDAPGSLAFRHPSGRVFAYSLPELVDVLAAGFRRAELGLLACEPNWIYPLCNMISACAIRASDASRGNSHWARIAPNFHERLESDFLNCDGRIIPFVSSAIGLAPAVGGAVMQTFPCLFLDALFPDIARRQWLLARRELTPERMRRALWPIDVGNYRLTRASSYAASAAAAVAMGDEEVATRLLDALERDCPETTLEDVTHRPRASLWAHAVEFLARVGREGSLHRLVAQPPLAARGPFISEAAYPDILPASAHASGGALHAAIYPGRGAGVRTLTIGGLDPGRYYAVRANDERRIAADHSGEMRIDIALEKRTEVHLLPAD